MTIYGKAGVSGNQIMPGYMARSQGLIEMESECPSANHVAAEDGTWVITPEKFEEQYAAELATLDPLLAHILRHERNGEFERAARAESEFEIRQAEIMEKYGRGETVYITETGECYHTTEDCSALANAVGVREIKMSDGLKNYSPCSICCN